MSNKIIEKNGVNISPSLIHEGFFNMASQYPERIAVAQRQEAGGVKCFTYKEIAEKAMQYSGALIESNTKGIVAAALDKGAEFISAVMGILYAGCAYLPISATVPKERRKFICEKAEISTVITDRDSKVFFEEMGLMVITPEDVLEAGKAQAIEVNPENDAYIIFTSGTTGQPKGVDIQHFAASNTIKDINERFNVTEEDSVFAVSEIDFDLSVYDIFGILSVGGKVVICDKNMKKEAEQWKEFMKKEQPTVWNSVPMLFDMLLSADYKNEVVGNLRLILLSGDWIYPSLITRIREKNKTARIIALGGATEASIWSNCYEVGQEIDSSYKSVPYGKALTNQKYRIVSENGVIEGALEEGELQIGGVGLAKCYVNSPELTAERFIEDQGWRWYRTGDKGRYLEDGNIEFLGRLDNQVKFGGYRIELDEITKSLIAHERVSGAGTVMIQKNEKQMLASVVTEIINQVQEEPKQIGTTIDVSELLDKQAVIATAALMEILGLNKSQSLPIEADKLFSQLGFDSENRSVFDYWLTILEKYGYITNVHGKIALTDKKAESVIEEMKESITLLSDVMKGKKTAADMMKDEWLSPEKVSIREKGIIAGVNEIAEKINKLYEEEEMNLHVAVLGVRTGVVAEMLVNLTEDSDIDYTFIDQTPFFTSQAKQRLGEAHSYHIIKGVVPDDLRNAFDIVVDINDMHTYPDYEQGVFIVRELLKNHGKTYIVDLNQLPPLSFLSAAQMEKGFINFTKENRPQENNPVMPAKQAAGCYLRQGFCNVNWHSYEDSAFVILEAEKKKNSDESLTANALKYYLGQRLPEYMIPEKIVFASRIPLTKNGKPDRQALLDMVNTDDLSDLTPPSTETEKKLAVMWQDILHVDEVGVEQSFFRAGGDSLLATHLLTKVRQEFNVEFTLKEMYGEPTLGAIAALIDEKASNSGDEDMEFGEI